MGWIANEGQNIPKAGQTENQGTADSAGRIFEESLRMTPKKPQRPSLERAVPLERR